MCDVTAEQVSMTQQEILSISNGAAATYANTCIDGLSFCAHFGKVEIAMLLDPVSRADVVPYLTIDIEFPKVALLSTAREETIVTKFVSVVTGLNPYEVSIQKTPVVTLTNADSNSDSGSGRRLSSEDKIEPVFNYVLGINLQRFRTCRNASCDLMSQMSSCSCGATASDCRYLVDDICDEDLNCYKYLFDGGACDVQDCYERGTEKQFIKQYLGIYGCLCSILMRMLMTQTRSCNIPI